MLSINTNISSLITQTSMKQSTDKLNQAIERMTTGFKINHASDNAANYSISTNMTTKIGAYNIAEDNASMGLDMLTTASEGLSLIKDKLSRLRALATQSSNGTYGTQSKDAINAEANAIVDEIERIYNNTEYNGINLMKGRVVGTEESKFIKDIDRRDTSNMTTLASVDIDEKLEYGTYSISTAEELTKLATMTNNGLIAADTEFVLANDIDLSHIVNWTPIGIAPKIDGVTDWYSYRFLGNFDGNGYIVRGLNISTNVDAAQALFGVTAYGTIKNLGVEDFMITSQNTYYSAGLIGVTTLSTIENCYSTGTISSMTEVTGGFVAVTSASTILDCYSNVDITAGRLTGGLIGELRHGSILKNSYSVGNVKSNNSTVGGLVGQAGYSSITNPLGISSAPIIENCYSTGNVTGIHYVGGFIGSTLGSLIIRNSYCSGEISVTRSEGNISGFIGYLGTDSTMEIFIEKCSALSEFASSTQVTSRSGIFVGGFSRSLPKIYLKNCSYNSAITATTYVVGKDNSLYADSNITTCDDTKPFEIFADALVNTLNKNARIQVGLQSNDASCIGLELGYEINSLSTLKNIGLCAVNYLSIIDCLIEQVSLKQSEYGAVLNRLESVLEEITIQRDNLISSRSTIRDADIAEVSSHYIQQQILQQASATLLATANQSPSIALQLI